MYIDRYDCRTSSLGINPILVNLQITAEASLSKLDNALLAVNAYRSNCGAQQNSLDHAKTSIGLTYLNLEEANSRIADANMAE